MTFFLNVNRSNIYGILIRNNNKDMHLKVQLNIVERLELCVPSENVGNCS